MSELRQCRFSLGPSRRVRRSSDFHAARQKGRRVDAGVFLAWTRLRGDETVPRLGVAASRAVGGAVVRNRCKRLLRQAFRLNQQRIPLGWDIILSAKPATARTTFAEIEKRFLKLIASLDAKQLTG